MLVGSGMKHHLGALFMKNRVDYTFITHICYDIVNGNLRGQLGQLLFYLI